VPLRWSSSTWALLRSRDATASTGEAVHLLLEYRYSSTVPVQL
jgi:hypothetical protein